MQEVEFFFEMRAPLDASKWASRKEQGGAACTREHERERARESESESESEIECASDPGGDTPPDVGGAHAIALSLSLYILSLSLAVFWV